MSKSMLAPSGSAAISSAQVQALRRAALAVAHPGGPGLFEALAQELSASLQAACVLVSTFADDSQATLRTLAVCLDRKTLRNFDYPLPGTTCALVVGRSFQYIPTGVSTKFAGDNLGSARGMDSSRAFPLNDSAGQALG